MAEKERQRDWDRELAEVDKLLARLPNADPSLGRGAPAKAGPAAVARPASSGGTWLRVGLSVLLAIGMTVWPYPHECGLQLLYYGGGVAMVVFAGLWGAVSSWNRRSATAHILSLTAALWGLGLAAAIILPRAVYVDPAARWLCQ